MKLLKEMLSMRDPAPSITQEQINEQYRTNAGWDKRLSLLTENHELSHSATTHARSLIKKLTVKQS